MRNSRRMVALFIAAIAISFAAAGTTEAAFDKDELKCRGTIAKGFLKAIGAADKVSAGCHKDRHNSKVLPAVDCNDLGPAPGSPGAADTKGKFEKAQQKLIDGVAGKCVALDDDVLGEFISCPEPCNTDLGLATPLTDLGEVASCLACMAGDIVGNKNATLLGAPDPGLMSKDDAKCAQTVAKGYAKYLSTILKTRTKCQNGIEKDGGSGLDANCQNSADPDGKGKIAKAQLKAEGLIDKKCLTADLTNVGACSTVDILSLKACAKVEADAADVVGFPPHYELAPTICPVGLVSTVLAGNGENGSVSNSRLDVGWTGLGHYFDIPGDYTFEADLTCPNGSPPCGTCSIDGVSPTGANYDRFLRCTSDFSIRCTMPFLPDPACGGSPCTYVLGPPLPLNAGNSPTCSVNALQVNISGTAIVETGDSQLNLSLATKVFTPGVVLQPCPVCVGDITPNDDNQDGLCAGGSSRDGMPCDTNGFDVTFASASSNEGLSLDCSPDATANISGGGLKIDLPLTTASHSLSPNNKCEAPLGFLDCWCGQCNGDVSIACRDDAECATAGAGTCTTTSGGAAVNRVPNACAGFVCNDIGNENGECDVDTKLYCDGIQKGDGGPFVACLNNDECGPDPMFSPCAPLGGCGTCSQDEPVPCFLNPIEGTGVADPKNPTMVGNFCLSPTVNSAINGTTGSPGPGRVAISQRVKHVY